VRRSVSSRSTDRRRRPERAGRVDVYLFPAIVGGGLGDIEEVLAAGRRLARAGASVRLFRAPGRPPPPGVDGPWEWPPLERTGRLRPSAPRALTVTPAWGVSAAPAGPPPLGRPGVWDIEARAIETAYGPDHVVHVSLEEFARTLPSRDEHRERFREGGVPARAIDRRLLRARAAGEIDAFDRAFRRFRAFDRPDVLHLFATFEPARAFAREFPEAVQTGPLWPGRAPRGALGRRRPREWVWYASPASAERIAGAVVAALANVDPPIHLLVRTPRPWRTVRPGPGLELVAAPLPPARWRMRFAAAELRIVTGSRSLLEAIELGGPFLYFNGLLGEGRSRRRHRPEKLRALLRIARRAPLPPDVVRDLAAFGRGARVADVAHRAAARVGGWSRRWPRLGAVGFRPPYDDAGVLLERLLDALGASGSSATEIVARVRAGSNP